MNLYNTVSLCEEDTFLLGQKFGERIKTLLSQSKDNSTPVDEYEKYISSAIYDDGIIFVAFYGDLGSGKTVFIRGMASVLTPDANVQSPSYSIVNEYLSENFRFCHFDMYRISSDDDLLSCGFYDYSDAILAIEWSEKIPFALPDAYWKVNFEKNGDKSRIIKIDFVSDM